MRERETTRETAFFSIPCVRERPHERPLFCLSRERKRDHTRDRLVLSAVSSEMREREGRKEKEGGVGVEGENERVL